MRRWILCLWFAVAAVALAGPSREETHNGVKFTFQGGADANPTGIVEVATGFVDALNHQDAEKASNLVHKGQKETWKTHLAKKQEKRVLSLEGVLVFIGDYRIEGKKVRDQLMARISTRATDGKGSMSFLMIQDEGKWVVAAD